MNCGRGCKYHLKVANTSQRVYNDVMKTSLRVLMAALGLAGCFSPASPTPPEPYPALDFSVIKGADISYVPELEALGATFSHKGYQENLVSMYRRAGFNWIRLRVWNSPAAPHYYNGLTKVVALAKRAKNLGLKVLVDFHYSDTWADPGNQSKPATWSGLSLTDLKTALQDYTRTSLEQFATAGVQLDMVQIGNEIGSGFLWPTGDLRGANDTAGQWQNFADLLAAARAGVTQAVGTGPAIPVMIHVQSGADQAMLTWFFDKLTAKGVNFDLIGLSYYPFWSNASTGRDWTQLTTLWNLLWTKYAKPVILAEVAYPWSLTNYDSTNNFVWQNSDLAAGYPATPAGQALWLKDATQAVRNLNQTGERGWFWWAPEWVSVPGLSSSWDNLTLFDNYRQSLPGLEVSSF